MGGKESWDGKMLVVHRFFCFDCGIGDEIEAGRNRAMAWARSLGWHTIRGKWYCPTCRTHGRK